MAGQSIPLSDLTAEERAELERKRRLLDILAVSGIVCGGAFLAIMLAPPLANMAHIAIFALLLLICVVALVLNRRNHFLTASLLWLFSLTLAIFGVILVGLFLDREIDFEIYYFPITVLCAGMLLGSRATFGFATLNVLLIIIISLVAGCTIFIGTNDYYNEVISLVVPPAILCYLMALVAWLYGNSLESALRGLRERSQQLQAANKEIRAFSHTLEDKVEERTQELREFVSMVAHDLRNPLTTVWGYVEMLEEQGAMASDELRSRAFTTITANVQHMIHMTDDLLEISRLQSGRVQFEMESLPLEHVIQEVCEGFERRLAEKRLGIKVDLPPKLPPVWGDRFRLTQALNNLVGNACNYTPSGTITVGARSANGCVEVSISDTGIGIPPEELKRLFTRFFRGDHQVVRRQKGTGLGLTITQSIIQAHGGDISVESEVNKGTTFRFTVPVAGDRTAESAKPLIGNLPV